MMRSCRGRLPSYRRVTQCRHMAVYAMGEGWTGALGTGRLDQVIPGHEDDDEPLDTPPALVYPGPTKSVAAGWGHSCLITREGQLLLCGRPHDFSNLLRLKRLPYLMRHYAVQHALRYSAGDKDSFSGTIISWMMGSSNEAWYDAQRNSILQEFVPIEMPEVPKSVVASAGLTAVLSETGRLYAFGLNHHGQCGVGKTSNNEWIPKPVQFKRFLDEQENPITSVALGLQHGLALDSEGNLFVWGKGERGQLGLQEEASCESATRLQRFRLPSRDGRQKWANDLKIAHIAAGMSHSAVVAEDNMVFLWGKNMLKTNDESLGKPVTDANVPTFVSGLPQHVAVQGIACGSHHTAMLLQDGSVWAVGFATDSSDAIMDAVEIVPPGVIQLPCLSFKAHFDRTTIVDKDGHVFQVHLWSEQDMRDEAVFTPAWVDFFDDKSIENVERGWLHTLVSTKG